MLCWVLGRCSPCITHIEQSCLLCLPPPLTPLQRPPPPRPPPPPCTAFTFRAQGGCELRAADAEPLAAAVGPWRGRAEDRPFARRAGSSVCIRCHLGWHCCTLPPQGQQPQQLVRGPSLAQLHHCSCMCVFELAGPDRPGLLAEVTHLLTWNWMRQQRHCLHSSRHRRSRRRCSRGRCTRCLTLRPWT